MSQIKSSKMSFTILQNTKFKAASQEFILLYLWGISAEILNTYIFISHSSSWAHEVPAILFLKAILHSNFLLPFFVCVCVFLFLVHVLISCICKHELINECVLHRSVEKLTCERQRVESCDSNTPLLQFAELERLVRKWKRLCNDPQKHLRLTLKCQTHIVQ